MKRSRRNFLILATAAATPALARIAKAEDYPSRPLHLVIQIPPGGSPDIVGRLMAQWLSDRLGQPVLVDKRAGANGQIGTEIAAKKGADRYTLLPALLAQHIHPSHYH